MLSSVCSMSDALQIPIHFALTRLESEVCVARCRAGDGPVDVPDVWLQVIRGPTSQVGALVTDVSDSPAAVDYWASANCSRWIPMLRITSLNESYQLPMLRPLPIWTPATVTNGGRLT